MPEKPLPRPRPAPTHQTKERNTCEKKEVKEQTNQSNLSKLYCSYIKITNLMKQYISHSRNELPRPGVTKDVPLNDEDRPICCC